MLKCSSFALSRIARLALCSAALLLTPPAQAGVFDDEEARKWIKNLETRLDNDQRAVNQRLDRLDTAARGQIELSNQIEGLKGDLAKLRGQIEVLVNELENSQKRQRDFYLDLDRRIKQLEPPPAPTPGAPPAPPSANETKAYEDSLALIRSGNYKGAVDSLTNFLRQFPNSQLAPSAWYWIGNSQFAQKDYKAALVSQQKVIDVYPDNAKAPDAMLNIASNQIELADKKSACSTLENLMKKYPTSEAAESAKSRIARVRAPGGRSC